MDEQQDVAVETPREWVSDMRRVQGDVVMLGTVTREVRDGQG